LAIEDELLKEERVERELTPHPLSFFSLQCISLFILIWGLLFGWIINSSGYWDGIESFIGNIFGGFVFIPALLFWWAITLIGGIVFSLLFIRWRIFFLYIGVLLLGTILMFLTGWQNNYGVFIPLYSTIIGILGLFIIDIYRRSHKYIITNFRIIFKGGILRKRERTLRYDKVTDIDSSQGIMGQIFDFGTIIPITQSGFGLGRDSSFAAMGVGGKATGKIGLFGIFGGGKEVQTPRARSYYELHGIYPYKEARKLIESLVQGNIIVPYQKEQVEYQKEQLDIQKQMKALLEKQLELKEQEDEEEL
jgi:membrane protein YdbS with pleckstrin-like domain